MRYLFTRDGKHRKNKIWFQIPDFLKLDIIFEKKLCEREGANSNTKIWIFEQKFEFLNKNSNFWTKTWIFEQKLMKKKKPKKPDKQQQPSNNKVLNLE